jgi:hypothetical protein
MHNSTPPLQREPLTRTSEQTTDVVVQGAHVEFETQATRYGAVMRRLLDRNESVSNQPPHRMEGKLELIDLTSTRESARHAAHARHPLVLVEHANDGSSDFNRIGGTSFSAEDQATLRHVAGVLAMLVGIALSLGIISVLA